MPPKSKGKVRAFKTTSSTTKTSSSSNDAEPPAPFKRAPKNLEPFLSKLTKNHIYITHIDNKPKDFKRKIFLVPFFMNVAIIALLVWRIAGIGPFYLKICFSLMGRYNETTIDTAKLALNDIGYEILRRTGIFMIDLLIYVFIWPWPRDFFAGRTIGNPIAWRFAVGFQDKEIIVRRSRKWDRHVKNILEEGPEQETAFQIIKRAVSPLWMSEKTGYLMLNKEWDLDWRRMVIATRLVNRNVLKFNDFTTAVFAHSEEFGWMVEVAGAEGVSAAEEEGRRKIVAFKEELTALGKENLFFSWIELVQFASSQPGGFGPDKQRSTMVEAKKMFEDQGVDFDKFWAKVGGMKGMPGMDEI